VGLLRNETTVEARANDARRPARDCATYFAQLNDPDAMARRRAIRDMQECDGASDALVAQLHMETNDSVREAILTVLTSIGDEVAVAGLMYCLRSEEVSLRNEAIDAMKQLPGHAAPIMSALLCDGNSDVRIFAVNVLESLRHPDVEAWLLTVIEQDPHVNVCATALDLLGEVGTAAARDPLHALKARFADVPYIQFAADLALSRLADV
jgi:HEAT repeat protein